MAECPHWVLVTDTFWAKSFSILLALTLQPLNMKPNYLALLSTYLILFLIFHLLQPFPDHLLRMTNVLSP